MKNVNIFASVFLSLFYVGILLYVLLGVFSLQQYENFTITIIFQVIGFLALFGFVVFGRFIHLAYRIPLTSITIAYNVVIDIFNILATAKLSPTIFLIVHLVFLFIYCLLAVPMLVTGKNN